MRRTMQQSVGFQFVVASLGYCMSFSPPLTPITPFCTETEYESDSRGSHILLHATPCD